MIAKKQYFESLALPYLNAAYNLARWLLRDDISAQDAVQDAYLRAFRFFDGFNGSDIRPWLLGIVRNVCFTHLSAHLHRNEHIEFDEEMHSLLDSVDSSAWMNPETALLAKANRQELNAAIESLPVNYREVLILREFEELSYEEIAHIVGIPAGTVMSRLARARAFLRAALVKKGGQSWNL